MDVVDDDVVAENVLIEERLGVETLTTVIINFKSYEINDYDYMVCSLHQLGSYKYDPKRLDVNLKNRTTPHL